MPVSYIGAIRSVLDTYPPSKGLFREILQNSEDAKASKQVFVLDHRVKSNVPESTIIVQSPALLAYNDSTFTERDFESIFNLWDSSKKADTSKIGKYGMGFRSTFHITDTPQILSEYTLAILDPLSTTHPTDRRIDLTGRYTESLTALTLDIFQPDISATNANFHGTVVRLPLRALPSELSEKVFSAADIRLLLEDFIKDEIRIVLLFLSNVSSIEILEIGIDGQRSCLAKSTISRSASMPVIREISPGTQAASFIDLAEECIHDHDLQGGTQSTERWRVLHASFSDQEATSELSKRLEYDASSVLERHKLRPILSIAVKLSILDKPQTMAGRLFTYLPLPLMTHFCGHVHGLFALTPSREKLQNREETPARGSDYHISVEWNKLLFDMYLPQAWTFLLSNLADSGIKNVFAAWPPAPRLNQLGDSGYWEKLPAKLVDSIIESRCHVWPIVGSAGVFHELRDVLVAGVDVSQKLLNALAAIGLRIVRPPQFVTDLLKRNVRTNFLSPGTAYASLLKFTDNLALNPPPDLPIVTRYLLSTNDLKYIIDLPIIPLVNNRLVALTSRGQSECVHVLLEMSDSKVFKACDKNAISLDSLDSSVASLLKQEGPNVLNVKLLSPEVVLGYIEGHSILASGAEYGNAVVTWVSNFWMWMKTWEYSSHLYPLLGHLPLLPTLNGLKPAYSAVFESKGMHPMHLSPLKKLRVSFLHHDFGASPRSALISFRSLSNGQNLIDVFNALDLKVAESLEVDEEGARQLVEYLSSCVPPQQLDSDQRQKLCALPIFPLYSRTVQSRIRIPNGSKVLSVVLKDLHLLPLVENTVILDGSKLSNMSLLQMMDSTYRRPLYDLDVLRFGLSQFSTQPDDIQEGFVSFMATHRNKVPGELSEVLATSTFVKVSQGPKRCPRDLVDPGSPLAALFDAESDCLPLIRNSNNSKLIANLRALDLLQTTLSTEILGERIRHITETNDYDCACVLVQVIYDTRFQLPPIKAIFNNWLPTPRGLRSPHECRDDEPHRRELFDCVLSPLDDRVRTHRSFRAAMGWDQPISTSVLAQQLGHILSKPGDPYGPVHSIIKELMERKLTDEEIMNLSDKVAGRAWVPVSGTNHRLVISEHAVFSGEDPRAGFYQIIFPGSKARSFFMRLGCSERPSTSAILQYLSYLKASLDPSSSIAKTALYLLQLLPADAMSEDVRSQVLVPDVNLILRPLPSVFFNDIGERAILVNLKDDHFLVHPKLVDDTLARSLRIKRLGLEFVDLKPLGIDMGEKLSTTIKNKLRSYTHRQILTEFIANASDAGATEFNIMMDERTTSPSRNVLAQSLVKFHESSSLVLFNNAVFTEADFEGICQTGVGGKSNRRDSIGQFGFGALTMFHLSDVAMIISGNSVLFLDPSKELLPIHNRAALLLPLQHMKRMYPAHLEPLDGIFGFEASSENGYNGTLFRLPLRTSLTTSSLGDIWDMHRVQKDIIHRIEDSAHEFLLFTTIRKIAVLHRTSEGKLQHLWRITSSERAEKAGDEFQSKCLDVTIVRRGSNQDTERQSWHIVSTVARGQHDSSSELLAKYKIRSPVTLAMAARIHVKNHHSKTVKDTKTVHKFFSTLPLTSSTLPVHLSAPFILSDDRRQIRLDNLDPTAATFNRWLLSTAVPPLYLFLLSDFLWHYQYNHPCWPGDTAEEDALTQLVTTSFYDTFLNVTQQRVFLHAYAVGGTTPLLPKDVVLFSPPWGNTLSKVFRLLNVPLASLPFRVVRRAYQAGLSELTPVYLCGLIRGSSVNPAHHLQAEELDILFTFLGKSPDHLIGLALLPLSSRTFGVIEKAANASRTYFIAPESAHEMFPENQHFIHEGFPLTKVPPALLAKINVDKFSGTALKRALTDVLPEEPNADHNAELQSWIVTFWMHYPYLNTKLADISNFPLVPTSKYGSYTSINNCRNRSAVILSNTAEPAWLWPALRNLGLVVVERHADDFPLYLKNDVFAGADFSNTLSFNDVLSAISNVQHGVIGRFTHIDASNQHLLSQWCRRKLTSGGRISGNLVLAKQLPIWPVMQSTGVQMHLSADSVTMLPQGLSVDIARRFMNVSLTAHSVGLLNIQKVPLSFAGFFGSLELPKVLPERDIGQYRDLLTIFLNSTATSSFETLRVPDSNMVLRHPRDLYARDRLFLAAFGATSPQFIHTALTDMEHRFATFGMKREVDLDAAMFQLCARTLHNENLTANVDIERARIVYEAYCEVLPLRVASRQQYLWSTIDSIRFIPRNILRRMSSVPSGMDPSAYGKDIPLIVSANELMLPEFEAIAWTQRAHFHEQPGQRVLIVNPALGRPSFLEVVEHLKTLVLNVFPDFPSSPRLLEDLTETYKWLNTYCESNGDAVALLTHHAVPLFLNVQDPSEFSTWQWCAADHLLLNETKVVGKYHPVKAFLLPFERLLRATGVQTVVHPEVLLPIRVSSDSEQLASIRQGFLEMRKARLLTDVEFVAGDSDEDILPCHRTYLATYSSFFYDAFTNEIESANLNVSVSHPKRMNLGEYSSLCVASALDFAYTGTIGDEHSEDLDLMLDLMQLSDFWQMRRLHNEVQRLIVTRRLVNFGNCQRIENAARTYQANFLVEMCQEYKKKNQRLM